MALLQEYLNYVKLCMYTVYLFQFIDGKTFDVHIFS